MSERQRAGDAATNRRSGRRAFLQSSVMAAAAFATKRSLGEFAPSTPAKRPNIIVILADDLGYSDIGPYGGEIDTPNLDRLANNGLRFSAFYNSPRCCPSRAALLTGLYSHQAGMGMMTSDHGRYPFPAYDGSLSKHCVTIAEALKSAGYTTMMSGKWHQSPVEETTGDVDKSNWPLQRGFDRYYGIITGAADYYNPATLVRDNSPITEAAADFYLTDGIAENAVQFIEGAAKTEKPFFLYTAFNAPHWPLQAPESAIARFRGRYQRGWDVMRAERHTRQIKSGLINPGWKVTGRDSRVPAWDRASFKEWEVERMAVYAAQVYLMDAGIGRIMRKLEETGQYENTLILFMADNGGNYEEFGRMAADAKRPIFMREKTKQGEPVVSGNIPTIMPGPATTFQSYGGPWGNVSNTPFRLYKHYAHEGGISTPLVAHWPDGIRGKGRISHEIGHEIDLMPTFLEISGSSYPKISIAGDAPPPVEGRSLNAVFRGGGVANRGMLFWEHEGNCAVRDGKWKLVSSFPNTWELYDMQADRTETNNLADVYPTQTGRLAEAYRTWAKRVGAQPWPMPQTPPGERSGALPLPEYLKVDRQ
jgi:arylsulfatase A-like enzyme